MINRERLGFPAAFVLLARGVVLIVCHTSKVWRTCEKKLNHCNAHKKTAGF